MLIIHFKKNQKYLVIRSGQKFVYKRLNYHTSIADDVMDRESARLESKITLTRNVNESLIVLANNSNFYFHSHLKQKKCKVSCTILRKIRRFIVSECMYTYGIERIGGLFIPQRYKREGTDRSTDH